MRSLFLRETLSTPSSSQLPGMLGQWPNYMLDPDFGLLDPAHSASALTVGAISDSDALGNAAAGTVAVAQPGCPAPFTRHGPGLRGAIKPELVAPGGNWAVDLASGARIPDVGVEVLSTSNDIPDRLLCHLAGTSLAAPVIANALGQLQANYPDVDSRTLRALLLQSAAHSGPLVALYSPLWPMAIRSSLRALAGFGPIDMELGEYFTARTRRTLGRRCHRPRSVPCLPPAHGRSVHRYIRAACCVSRTSLRSAGALQACRVSRLHHGLLDSPWCQPRRRL